ncbi:MAG: hypothetical protein AB1757_25840 [Acidobacteriota bacterium]
MLMKEKPDYLSVNEWLRRLKEAQKRAAVREYDKMIHAKNFAATFGEIRRARKISAKHMLKRRWLIFLRDLDYFIDFCIARFIMWRAMRRKN